MNVAVVGSGPAAEAVVAALGDADATVERAGLDRVGDADLAVVVGAAGDDGFERANDAALDAAVPWLAVEVGGVGGRRREGVPGGVSALGPDGPCFRCLALRCDSVAGDGVEDGATTRADARLAGAHAGRLAVSAVEGTAVAGTVVESGPVPTRRELLAVPNCPACGAGRDRTLGRDDAERSLDDAAAAADRAVDERLGPVAVVGEQESYPAPYYLAESGSTTGFSDAAANRQAAGVAADWNAAYVKAIGEALERYAAGTYREDEFEVATRDDLERAVSPTAFVTPSDAPVASHGDDLAWVPGEHLASGSATSLPASFVHFPPPDEEYRPAITTGLGLGNSTVGALRSGLREVLERDAAMLAWYSTFEPLGLAVDDADFDALARRARSEDLTVTPLLLTQDVDVPVVAVAVHRDEWPRFALGSAAHLDGTAAAVDALEEALQNWMELRGLGPEDAADADAAIGRYAEFPEAAREFLDVDTTVPVGDVGPDTVPEGEAALEELVSRAADAGVEAYAARLTTRDLEALGFEAVRVLAPAAQPLFVEEPYFGERARTVPDELGFEARLDRPFHPFP